MTAKRILLEIGTGNDLHGRDYTKAAMRAVEDAIHHSSLSLLPSYGIDPGSIHVDVMIGVQQPDKVNIEGVKSALPHGQITISVGKGGLDTPEEDGHDAAVIASAAIIVRLDLAGLQ